MACTDQSRRRRRPPPHHVSPPVLLCGNHVLRVCHAHACMSILRSSIGKQRKLLSVQLVDAVLEGGGVRWGVVSIIWMRQTVYYLVPLMSLAIASVGYRVSLFAPSWWARSDGCAMKGAFGRWAHILGNARGVGLLGTSLFQLFG